VAELPKLSVRLSGATHPRDCVALARIAEANGYHAVWFPENAFGRGALPAASACAAATTTIGIGIGVYVAAILWSYVMASTWEFYVLAVVIGLVQGGVQSLSRSLYAHMVPQSHAAEFFGFYNMLGKFAAVLGPLLVGFTAIMTGSSRFGVLAILVLFVAGGLILYFVGEREAAPAVRDSE